MALRTVPVSGEIAVAFVRAWHRHLPEPPPRYKFVTGVADGPRLVGVAIAGRPTAAALWDGLTLEITRTATDGTPNANSKLYGSCAQIARAFGYGQILTYNEDSESGASLRAAGFVPVSHRAARHGWDTPARPRRAGRDRVGRTRWSRVCNEGAQLWEFAAEPEPAAGRVSQPGLF